MVGRLASTTSSLMGDAWSAPLGKLAVRSDGPMKRGSIRARKGLEKKSVSESAQRASAILPARTTTRSISERRPLAQSAFRPVALTSKGTT